MTERWDQKAETAVTHPACLHNACIDRPTTAGSSSKEASKQPRRNGGHDPWGGRCPGGAGVDHAGGVDAGGVKKKNEAIRREEDMVDERAQDRWSRDLLHRADGGSSFLFPPTQVCGW